MDTQDNKKRNGVVLLGISLAIGLIVSAFIIAGAFEHIRQANQLITVKGYAEKIIASDYGTWVCEFSTQSASQSTGYDKIEQDLQKVLFFLESYGIKKESMDISPVSSNRLYRTTKEGGESNELYGYQLASHVKISSSDIKLIERISKESSRLIKDGVELNSYAPQYFYTKVNDVKIEMLSEASKDAKVRAEQLVKNSGSQVGALQSASQGVFQITPVHSNETSDYGVNDLTSIEKSIKLVITVEYHIK